MKVTIFGATGATGTSLTGQALAAGHEVTAVVRDPARLAVPAHPRLLIVTADAMDPVSIAPAVDGADAVINAIGPRDTGPTTVIADSVRSIILAMDKTGTGVSSTSAVQSPLTKARACTCAICSSPWRGARSSVMCAPTCAP